MLISMYGVRGAIRISLRFMLMSRCRAMHPVRNTVFGEQALHGCILDWMHTARRNAQTSIYNKSQTYGES